MTTNTESPKSATRDLVYLAGLLHDIKRFDTALEASWKTTLFYEEPSEAIGEIIKKADAWATSIDQQQSDKGTIPQSLKNLFNEVLIKGNKGAAGRFGFHKLSLAKETVLRESLGTSEQLRQGFADAVQQLPTGNLNAFSGTLYHLLRQYTWCVPASSAAGLESISLFHHLKLTGAFAQCLYDAQTDGAVDDFPVQLLCVDLSGIQSFIYNIGPKYAAKSLKGRSFSLQLLLDCISRKLIQETDTTASHLVYSSGGKFFMLLPNTERINASITNAEEAIQQAVWDTYQGSLFVCFGRVPFDYNPDNRVIRMAEKGDKLSDLWKQVTQKAAEQKARKNRALILKANQFDTFFGPTGKGGLTDQCPVTGWEGPLVVIRKDEPKVHSSVKTQIDIGADLKDVKFITFGAGTFNLLPATDKEADPILLPFSLTDPGNLSANTEYAQLMQPGTTNSFLLGTSQADVVRSVRFYGGSKQAISSTDKRLPKTFEELAGIIREDPEDETSPIKHREGNYNRMAVLRMDVDSLGELFTRGLPDEKATFSAYATLSGLLDWFFSGYLNTIREDYANWVNIVYSGGDDVFAVGRWDKIIDFADHIQRDFKTFTGRPDLTISAGIVLMRPRYPIGKAADQAGEAEHQAKDHEYNGHPKNAISLFGVAVNWDKEWPFVMTYHQKFVDWLRDGTLSKGILQKLFAYYDIYAKGEANRRAAEKRGQTDYKLDLSWKWNAAYTLSRSRTDRNKEAIDDLKILLFTEINGGKVRFEALAMAIRWAELTVRDYPKTKQNDGIIETRQD